MNVRWVVQSNLLAEDDILVLKAACDNARVSFEPVQVVPFSDDLPEFALDDKENVYYGSITFIDRVRAKLKNPKGIFFDEYSFSMENYKAQWGAHMLNSDAKKTTLKEFCAEENASDSLWFVRPDADDKSFAGELMEFGDAQQWRQKLMTSVLAERELGNKSALTEDTAIIVGPPYMIEKEWRNYIVDGEIVTSSLYRKNFKLNKQRSGPEEMLDFVRARCKEYVPNPAFVMDIALCNGEYFIIECGCINSAGFYACDVDKLVNAISNHLAK